MSDFQPFLDAYGLDQGQVVLYPYGSRVYGTHKDDSDYDYLAVISGESMVPTGLEYRHGDVNVHMYMHRDWAQQLQDHKIHCLEAYYSSESCRKKYSWFKLDPVRLRHELSKKASNSFVKAKKKIDVEKDFYIGWKSLFHSLRILNFGIQMVQQGKIADFSNANHYWTEIVNAQQYNWQYFKDKYQGEYNRLATEFRKGAPKA